MFVHFSARNSFVLSEHVTVTYESVAFAKVCRSMIGLLKMDKNIIYIILNKLSYWFMIYIMCNERKYRRLRTMFIFTDYIWKQKGLLCR